jgi:urea transport system substrate-binding protein
LTKRDFEFQIGGSGSRAKKLYTGSLIDTHVNGNAAPHFRLSGNVESVEIDRMTKKTFRVGVFLSLNGPYGLPVRSMYDGVRIALDEINRDPALKIRLEPVFVDPAGRDNRYRELGAELLDSGIRQLVGCYTSSSRREVIPLIESGRGLLWFPMHYEGFETASNVVYTGASPNHHIVPLISYLLDRKLRTGFNVGSNYIWAWENNRILAETLLQNEGRVVGERLLAVGDTGAAIDAAIGAILDASPDFVFNTLIGDSAYAFFRRFREACTVAGIDQPSRFPIASCTLNEPELMSIGQDACDGHISSSIYFSSLQSRANQEFLRKFEERGIASTQACADAETTYIAVKMMAQCINDVGTDEPAAVIRALQEQRLDAPQGPVWVDQVNLHAYATPRIGRSKKDFTFDILAEASSPEAPDPYLIKTTPHLEVASPEDLRIAS